MTVSPSSKDPRKPEEPSSSKESLSDKFDAFRKDEKIEGIISFAKSNTSDTLAYVFLIMGIILLFFQPLYGGTLIGIIIGIYFCKEITFLLRSLNEVIDQQGMVRSLILGGITLAFFISAPAIFIATAVTVALKQLIFPEYPSKPPEQVDK